MKLPLLDKRNDNQFREFETSRCQLPAEYPSVELFCLVVSREKSFDSLITRHLLRRRRRRRRIGRSQQIRFQVDCAGVLWWQPKLCKLSRRGRCIARCRQDTTLLLLFGVQDFTVAAAAAAAAGLTHELFSTISFINYLPTGIVW